MRNEQCRYALQRNAFFREVENHHIGYSSLITHYSFETPEVLPEPIGEALVRGIKKGLCSFLRRAT